MKRYFSNSNQLEHPFSNFFHAITDLVIFRYSFYLPFLHEENRAHCEEMSLDLFSATPTLYLSPLPFTACLRDIS